MALCLCGRVQAALDPELKTPYQIHIVLQVAEHRFFTPQFQEQLQRDVGKRVQRALGPLATVEVARSHPLLADIQARGLGPAIDGFDSYSERRTCFVQLDYVDGRYDVGTRFHDGPSGLASPRGRQASTFERGQVAAVVAGLVEEDFLPTGTVTALGKEVQVRFQGNDIGVALEVQITFQGGGLGIALDKHLKPGEVLAVSKIVQQAGKTKAVRMDWALLEALEAPQGGVVKCRYWKRYQEDQLRDGAGVLGYRCLKLPTGAGKLKVQLVGEKDQPLSGWQVHVAQPEGTEPLQRATNGDGLAIFPGPLRHFALVKVISGKTVWAEFPAPLVDDRPIVCRLGAKPGAEGQAPLEIRADQWLRRLYDNLALAAERSSELQRLLAKSFDAALKQARAGHVNLQDELAYLSNERADLDRLADSQKLPRLDLKEGDERLAELQAQEQRLTAFIERVEKIRTSSDNPEELGLKRLIERAGLLEAEAEFAQAIQLYDQAYQASEQKDVKARVDALRAGWKLKDDDHAKAREFIYQTWPRLEAGDLKGQLKKAEAALATCKAAGDKLTPRKLLLANAGHAANLKKRLDELRRKDTADNRRQAEVIAQTATGLRILHAEAVAWMKGK